jgi:hypothetical protein
MFKRMPKDKNKRAKFLEKPERSSGAILSFIPLEKILQAVR